MILRVFRMSLLPSMALLATISTWAACEKDFAAVLGTDADEILERAGSRRFVAHIERLAKAIDAEKDPIKLTDALMKEDLRSTAFKAEELGRIYRDESKEMAKFFEKFKGFEDALGKVDESATDLKFLQSLKPTAEMRKAHEILTAYARGRFEANREAFARFLVREKWVDKKVGGMGEALDKAVKWLEDTDWHKRSKDRKIFLRAMDDHLALLGSNPYDMNVLQGKTGIHQLRRDIRKFLIQAQAADGLVILKPDPHPEKLPARTRDLLKTFSTPEARKYVTFPPNPLEKKPAKLGESNVMWTSDMVKRIGDVKEYGEAEEALLEAAVKTGLAADHHAAKEVIEPFLRLHPKYDPAQPDLHIRARALYDEFKRMGVVDGLRRDLKRALE